MTAAKRYEKGKQSLVHTGILLSEYLRVVFSISGVQSNRLKVQTAVKVDRGDDVS